MSVVLVLPCGVYVTVPVRGTFVPLLHIRNAFAVGLRLGSEFLEHQQHAADLPEEPQNVTRTHTQTQRHTHATATLSVSQCVSHTPAMLPLDFITAASMAL